MRRSDGFSLYEILIVIGILSIFSVYTIGQFTNTAHRRRAKDLVRISDVNTLMEAIEEYYVDNDRLPGNPGQTYRSDLDPDGGPCSQCDQLVGGWIEEDLSGYLEKLPVDPDNASPLVYRYRHNGEIYQIDCQLEFSGHQKKMEEDGGLDIERYELGTGVGVLAF